MSLPDRVTRQWYARQRSIAARAVGTTAKVWAVLNKGDLTGSWDAGAGKYLVRVLTGSQTLAAAGATTYASELVTEAGIKPDPVGRVNPVAFAGSAFDGGQLESLLYLPFITTKEAIGHGVAADQAYKLGLAQLLRIVATELGDAARNAAAVAGTADPSVIGYVRYLSLPSCSRCVVLAGRLYKQEASFARHPACDCQNRPITQGQWDQHRADITASPKQFVDESSDAQLATAGFNKAEITALREGADVSQVVNAHRQHGEYAGFGGRKFTREGTTRRGVAGERMRTAGKQLRPTVRQIYADATGRDEQIQLLTQYGYLL